MNASSTTAFGPRPRLQANWDWRAACNFMAGGAGSGLVVWSVLGSEPTRAPGMVLGAIVMALGLVAVGAEIGRPRRALNVFLHARRSWMSREAIAAALVFAATIAALAGVVAAAWASALAALGFVYCQAQILHAAKGIPAWRAPLIVPALVVTALAGGGGAWLLLDAVRERAPTPAWAAFAVLLLARLTLWAAWRSRLRTAPAALAAIDGAQRRGQAATYAALALALAVFMAPLDEGYARALQALAGVLALGAGLWPLFVLITRAAYTQGFTLPRLPVRGVPRRQGE